MNKRLDNADIASLNIPEKYRSETWIGKGGNITDETKSFAKILIVGKWEKYFVWCYRGDLYDPYYEGKILKKNDESLCKLKKVNSEVFTNYLRYLKTKNSIFLSRARRIRRESYE